MNCQQKAKGPQRHPDPDVVRNAEAVFAEMGMTPEEAVAVLYKQTALHGSFPITTSSPTRRPRKPPAGPEAGLDVSKYGRVDDAMTGFEDVRT